MNFVNHLTSNLRLIMQRPPRQQYAALCYRKTKADGQIEVLVATSRDTGRWVIPKGWPMKGKQAHEVAQQEALEEVGIEGKVEKQVLGYYHYTKTLNDGLKVPVRVQVHALEVHGQVKNFKEKGSRRQEWVACAEAAQRVREPELKAIFLEFATTHSQPQVNVVANTER